MTIYHWIGLASYLLGFVAVLLGEYHDTDWNSQVYGSVMRNAIIAFCVAGAWPLVVVVNSTLVLCAWVHKALVRTSQVVGDVRIGR